MADKATLQFVGTATTVLRLGSFTLLTDPNLLHRRQRAWLGGGRWSKWLTESALTAAELSRLDAIILSHLHGDHFDRVARHELAREQPILTTPQAATRLGRWGFQTRPLEDVRRESDTGQRQQGMDEDGRTPGVGDPGGNGDRIAPGGAAHQIEPGRDWVFCGRLGSDVEAGAADPDDSSRRRRLQGEQATSRPLSRRFSMS